MCSWGILCAAGYEAFLKFSTVHHVFFTASIQNDGEFHNRNVNET